MANEPVPYRGGLANLKPGEPQMLNEDYEVVVRRRKNRRRRRGKRGQGFFEWLLNCCGQVVEGVGIAAVDATFKKRK